MDCCYAHMINKDMTTHRLSCLLKPLLDFCLVKSTSTWPHVKTHTHTQTHAQDNDHAQDFMFVQTTYGFLPWLINKDMTTHRIAIWLIHLWISAMYNLKSYYVVRPARRKTDGENKTDGSKRNERTTNYNKRPRLWLPINKFMRPPHTHKLDKTGWASAH